MYWEKYISTTEFLIEDNISKLKNKLIKSERIKAVEQSLFGKYFYLLCAKYSMGIDVRLLKKEWIESVYWLDKSWDSEMLCKAGNPIKHYKFFNLAVYDEILWLLSLGYLLEIDIKLFNILVDKIDSLNVKDFLLNFIIRAKITSRVEISEESYEKYFKVPISFKSLREAINTTDNAQASKLVSQFVRKEWYNNHKSCAWVGTHSSKFDIYPGYWCFEAAAVTKIMGLDDSSYRDWKYYPKDLVNLF